MISENKVTINNIFLQEAMTLALDNDNCLTLDNLFLPSTPSENSNDVNTINPDHSFNSKGNSDAISSSIPSVISSMYERFEQTASAIKLSFVIDKINKTCLFEYVDFALHENLTPQMRLKMFCTLLRNCVCELINREITHIYHVISLSDYNEIKDKTSWEITNHEDFLSVYKSFNDINQGGAVEENVVLVCAIRKFVDNIANGLGINLS